MRQALADIPSALNAVLAGDFGPANALDPLKRALLDKELLRFRNRGHLPDKPPRPIDELPEFRRLQEIDAKIAEAQRELEREPTRTQGSHRSGWQSTLDRLQRLRDAVVPAVTTHNRRLELWAELQDIERRIAEAQSAG